MEISESKPQIELSENPRATWDGCSVLLDINDGDRLVFARLSAGAKVKIGNKNCSLQPLIGCPFGSFFRVENGAEGPYLARYTLSTEGNNVPEKGEIQSVDEFRDNRALVDNNKAQSLTGEDINAIRQQGATGDEIVEALIANSATFEMKTVFSQEKYRLKKQKKYAPIVLMRRPFTRSICEAYLKKYPNKIGFLRMDTLSLLLSMANVSANSDVLVVDMVGGLLTGAVAERLGGMGYVCNTYLGGSPYSMDIARIFNFGDEICKRIVKSPLTDLLSFQNGLPKPVSQDTDSCNMEFRPNGQIFSAVSTEEVTLTSENVISEPVPESTSSPVIKISKPAKLGENAPQEIISSWKENGFSSLIIAAPELDAWGLVKEILPLMSNSAPFAIFQQYLQPLATCMHNLQQGKMAIGMQISEPWLREYQVLPSRTHPCMQMNGFGGYILSGTKISPN
ncbi:tRNA (adenine(58)-N(1))-methyltransferase non-catalytic subunit trm6-like [Pyrus x bretschneideri]|uniref:tRNA (adenine(58)-N(1))-methyltransferase non-catalytic subunit trm6-like n=1 Tax=Pyrus x bretschneideri TaxID=225117 RepID=UPI00202F3A1D|nr:tRNA (adenine(58)-N(1))-methyltransferase non-catalytic subunit trm6-like [Pyrus x bretschneideri]